jgi:hypothetical protein
MKIEEYVSLNRFWGYSIKKIGNNYFHYRWVRERSFPLNSSFPPNQRISVDRKLMNALKWRFLISPVLIDAPRKDSYEYVLTTGNYGLEQFDRKTRNRIRKSLKTCTFRRPTLENLLNDGLSINRQTCGRQARKEKMLITDKHWCKYITSIHSNEEFMILGAYFEERMAGYLIAYELEGKFNLLQAFIDREYSSVTNPMCGLLYIMINDLIKKQGPVTISYGMHKLSGSNPLNRYKQHMLFEVIPASRGYIVNPVLLSFIRLVIFITIKIRKRKSVRSKWIRYFVELYQGHRILMTVMQSHELPGQETGTFRHGAELANNYAVKKTA